MTAIASRPEASDHGPVSKDVLIDGTLDEVLQVVDRLSAEFATVTIGDLTAVVVECRIARSGVPAPPLRELLERLARTRLAAAID